MPKKNSAVPRFEGTGRDAEAGSTRGTGRSLRRAGVELLDRALEVTLEAIVRWHQKNPEMLIAAAVTLSDLPAPQEAHPSQQRIGWPLGRYSLTEFSSRR